MFEKLARHLARWHAKTKHDKQNGTLARKNEKLAHFWHVGMSTTLARKHVGTKTTLERRHEWHAI